MGRVCVSAQRWGVYRVCVGRVQNMRFIRIIIASHLFTSRSWAFRMFACRVLGIKMSFIFSDSVAYESITIIPYYVSVYFIWRCPKCPAKLNSIADRASCLCASLCAWKSKYDAIVAIDTHYTNKRSENWKIRIECDGLRLPPTTQYLHKFAQHRQGKAKRKKEMRNARTKCENLWFQLLIFGVFFFFDCRSVAVKPETHNDRNHIEFHAAHGQNIPFVSHLFFAFAFFFFSFCRFEFNFRSLFEWLLIFTIHFDAELVNAGSHFHGAVVQRAWQKVWRGEIDTGKQFRKYWSSITWW